MQGFFKTKRKFFYKIFWSFLGFFYFFLLNLSVFYSDNFALSYALESSDFMRVITFDTPFFLSEKDSQYAFNLPYTYYVKILSEKNAFYHVEYGDEGFTIDGYVPKNYLFFDNQEIVSPYLNQPLTTICTTVLYGDKNLSINLRYIFPERELNYYGSATADDGSTIFFVGYFGQLGYVKENCVMPFEVVNHPNELTFIKKEEPEEPTEEKDDNTIVTLRILLITSLVLATVAGLIIILRKKPPQKDLDGYYDENEFQ